MNRIAEAYLQPRNIQLVDEEDMLPVRLNFLSNPHEAVVLLDRPRDGEEITIKIGGSYYSGGAAHLTSLFSGHSPDFDGTVGFRCSSDVMAGTASLF